MSSSHLSVINGGGFAAADSDRELIHEYCAQADVAESTRQRQRTQVDEFRCWLSHPRTRRAQGPAGLLDATRADVTRFSAYLIGGDRYASTSHYKVRAALAPGTRKTFLASLRSFYRYLMSVDLVQSNPTDAVPRPKVSSKPGLTLTAEELRQLLDALGSPRCRIQAYLLAFTAARSDEIRSLKWQDVDLDGKVLILHGKGDKYRAINIHPRLMPELRRWRLLCDHEAERNPDLRAARENPETNFVLLTRNGRQLPDTTIYKQLKRRAAKAGLYVLEPGHREHRSLVSPHALRRTFATLLLNDGHHIDAVADVLGHSSIDTTRKHYAFTSDARRKATIEGFDV